MNIQNELTTRLSQKINSAITSTELMKQYLDEWHKDTVEVASLELDEDDINMLLSLSNFLDDLVHTLDKNSNQVLFGFTTDVMEKAEKSRAEKKKPKLVK